MRPAVRARRGASGGRAGAPPGGWGGSRWSVRGARRPGRARAEGDETSENVRRLLRRDAKGFKDLDALSQQLAANLPKDASRDAPAAEPPAAAETPAASSPFADATPQTPSPFADGAADSASSSPFGAAGASPFADRGAGASPFGEAAGVAGSSASSSPFADGGPDPYDEPEDNGEPWWMFFKYITTTQVVIALSFSLIILLMLATFNVVLRSGGISFNDQ